MIKWTAVIYWTGVKWKGIKVSAVEFIGVEFIAVQCSDTQWVTFAVRVNSLF